MLLLSAASSPVLHRPLPAGASTCLALPAGTSTCLALPASSSTFLAAPAPAPAPCPCSLPFLRTTSSLRTFNGALARCSYDLEEWRAK